MCSRAGEAFICARPPGLEIGEQASERGPVSIRAGEAAVVVALVFELPAGLPIAVREAELALGIERVELMFQAHRREVEEEDSVPGRASHVHCHHRGRLEALAVVFETLATDNQELGHKRPEHANALAAFPSVLRVVSSPALSRRSQRSVTRTHKADAGVHVSYA